MVAALPILVVVTFLQEVTVLCGEVMAVVLVGMVHALEVMAVVLVGMVHALEVMADVAVVRVVAMAAIWGVQLDSWVPEAVLPDPLPQICAVTSCEMKMPPKFRLRGCWYEPDHRHCVVSLSKTQSSA